MAVHREACREDRTLTYWGFDKFAVNCDDGVRVNLENVLFAKEEAYNSPLADGYHTFKFYFDTFGPDSAMFQAVLNGLEMWP
jgi:hypothetical protein